MATHVHIVVMHVGGMLSVHHCLSSSDHSVLVGESHKYVMIHVNCKTMDKSKKMENYGK